MKRIFLLLSTLLFAIAGYGQSNGTFNKVRAKQLQAYPTPGELIILHDGAQDSEIFINSNAADSSLLTWMYHRLDSADLDAGEIDGVIIGANEAAAGSFTTIDADGGTIDGTVIGGTSAAAGSFTTANIDGGTIDGTVIGGSTPAAADFTNVTGTDFNGVALTDGGLTTRYLNEAGNYAIVNGAVTFGTENQIPSVNSSLDDYDYKSGLTHEAEPYNLLAAGFVHSLDVSGQDLTPNGISISRDRTELFIIGDADDVIDRFTLSTPGDLSTATYIHSLDISSQDIEPRGVEINSDGTELFMSGTENDNLYQYTLSTPYNLTTASLTHTEDISSEALDPRGISLSDDDTELYMGGLGSDIHRYTMSTPSDLSTVTYIHSLDVSSTNINVNGVSVSPDGTYLLVSSNSTTGYITRWTLGTPYNLTTGTYSQIIDVSDKETFPIGIDVEDSELFMVGIDNDEVHKYTMTRLHTNSLSVTGGSISAPTALTFSTSDTQAMTIDDSQVVTIGENDLGSDHIYENDKVILSGGDDSGISIVSTDAGSWGSYISLKQVDGTTFENQWAMGRQTNGDGGGDGDLKITYGTSADPYSNTLWLSLSDGSGGLNLPGYAGAGTQDAQFTSTGTFTRITSDEKTKTIYGKLHHGLDYVLSIAESTIEYDYKDPDLNADGYHYWGFGARSAVKQFGKNPAFREHEGIYYWDSKQMIAPAYNAIAELHETNKIMTSWIVGLLIFIFMQTFAMILVGRHYLTKIRNNE